MMAEIKVCVVDGCGNPTGQSGTARGMCRSHYKRWRRHGDPKAGGTPMGARIAWIEQNKSHNGSECLIWPFSRTASGYGQFKVRRRSTLASREMCRAAHGNPPSPDYQAAHSCGNGHMGCVNPKHLRWATPKDNTAERFEHGTVPLGEKHPNAKLTAADVTQIREASGTQVEIAERFGIARQTVGKIKRGFAWAWLD
jgi:hypothetical protein